jgi:hypothetical protein
VSAPLWAEQAQMDATSCAVLLYHVEPIRSHPIPSPCGVCVCVTAHTTHTTHTTYTPPIPSYPIPSYPIPSYSLPTPPLTSESAGV